MKNVLRTALAVAITLNSNQASAETWEARHQNQQVLTLSLERDCEVFPDYTMVCKDVSREKIQSAEALKNGYGEFQRHYNPKFENLTLRGAFIAPDGRRNSHKKVQDKPETGENAVYSDRHVVTMTMPELAVGGVVEVMSVFKVHTPKVKGLVSGGYTFDPWEKPAKRVRYSLTHPESMQLLVAPINGLPSPAESVAGGKRRLDWNFEDLDGIQEESHMPPYAAVARSVAFTNWTTWEDLDRAIFPLVDKASKSFPQLAALAAEITKDTPSTGDKIQAIFNYIDDNIRYVSMNLDQNGLTPHSAEETLKNKYGDCKDRTALAIALLREIGVKAFPCLVAPQEASIDKSVPTWTYFNHMIPVIDYEGLHFVESTDGGFPFKERHPGLDGRQVFVVNNQGGYWKELPGADISFPDPDVRTEIWLKPDGMGRLKEEQINTRKSVSGTRQAIRILLSKSAKEQAFINQEVLASYYPGIQGGALAFENIENRFGPIVLKSSGIIPNVATPGGPFLVLEAATHDLSSEFPDSPRKYDLWFTATQRERQDWTIHIPEGYEFMHLPKNIRITSEFKEFKRTVTQTGRTLQIVDESRDTPAKLGSDKYEDTKEFAQRLLKLTDEKVILRKK